MARKKNNTAAPDTARTAPAPGPGPSTVPVPADPAAAVQAALAASTGDGATVAGIAAAAGISRTAASKELAALEAAGAAARTKGGRPGIPDTWHQAAPATGPAAADETPAGTEDASGEPGEPGQQPDTGQPAANPGTGDQDEMTGHETAVAEPDQDGIAVADLAGSTPASASETETAADRAATTATIGHAAQITTAAEAVAAALVAGDVHAALAGVDEISDQAGQARRALKATIAGRKTAAVKPGALRELVAAHLHRHPGLEFTPHEVGKALGRSSGAVSNALDRLVGLGQAELSSEKPRRFRLAAAAAPAESQAEEPAGSTDEESLAGAA